MKSKKPPVYTFKEVVDRTLEKMIKDFKKVNEQTADLQYREKMIDAIDKFLHGKPWEIEDSFLREKYNWTAIRLGELRRAYQNIIHGRGVKPDMEFIRAKHYWYHFAEVFRLYLEWLRSDSKGYSVRHFALYYWYQQEVGLIDRFENHPKGKMKAIKEISASHGISPNTFQQKYNQLRREENRLSVSSDIERVIELLHDKPEAQKIAEDELKLASYKTGNPLT